MDITPLQQAVQQLHGDEAFPEALEAADWVRLAPWLRREDIDAGVLLMRRGEPGQVAYWIESGRLQVFVVGGPPGSHRIAQIGAGMWVGEPALFGAGPRMAHVEALTSVVAWSLTRARLQSLAATHPALAVKLLSGVGAVLAARMRANLERGIPLS